MQTNETIRTVVMVLKYLAMTGVAVFAAILVVILLTKVFSEKNQKAAMQGIDRTLKKVLKDDRTRRFKRYLVQTGIADRLSPMPVTPASYLLVMLCSGSVIGIGTYLLLDKYFWVGFLAGFFGFDLLMRGMNSSDNREIQQDVFLILMNLRVQLDAGIFISDALMACEPLLKNKRFRRAIDHLINDFGNQNISNLDAIEFFDNKFNSINVTNLKIFFRNYQLYGVSDKYLEDMMTQVNSMSEAEGLAQENDLDQKMGLCSLLFFGLLFFLMIFGMSQVISTQGIFG